MLTVRATTGTTHEQLRPLGRNCEGCYGDCGGCDQHGMSKNTVGKKCVTSNGYRKTDRPHQAQHLQDIMPDTDIGNMAKWAYLMVEHEIPCSNHKCFDTFDHGSVPFTDCDGTWLGRCYPTNHRVI